MADELRPYIYGSSSSAGAADADTAGGDEADAKKGGSSDSGGGGGSGVPLLTISDINPDMLEVKALCS